MSWNAYWSDWPGREGAGVLVGVYQQYDYYKTCVARPADMLHSRQFATPLETFYNALSDAHCGVLYISELDKNGQLNLVSIGDLKI